MDINNFIDSGKYRLYFTLSLVIILIAIAFLIIEGFKIINFVILILGLIAYIYLWLRKPYFVNFETTHRNIIFRFYHSHPLLKKPKMISVDINKFNGYEIIKKGMAEYIILSIKDGKKILKYPPVSISIVPDDMKNKIKNELNLILKTKRYK